MMMRLAKAISNKGYCSRREAEKLILQNRVKVNGELVLELVTMVEASDEIEIIGKKALQIKPQLWLYYKPVGIITTQNDPQMRRTAFEDFPIKSDAHIISVGRLDINSEGLLLMTNSKSLAALLENPANKFERVYKVRALGEPNKAIFQISKGITIEGTRYKPVKIQLIREGVNSWYEMILSEGKNREIRKIFEHFGLSVNRLIRTNYGPFALGDLKPGEAIAADINKFLQD
jgi:23S rRNA pseudouridine2605 synthase